MNRTAGPRARILAIVTWASLASVLAFALFSIGRNLTSGVADAHTFRTASKVSLHKSGKTFYGKVRSKRPRCKRNRVVTLVKARRGISDKVIKRDRTNAKGRWKIKRQARSKGRFYVVVSKRIGTTGYAGEDHLHKCKRDTSRTIRSPKR
ncbi:MAG: hypothetical protein ABR529_07380 [Actinomycetota bacterium]